MSQRRVPAKAPPQAPSPPAEPVGPGLLSRREFPGPAPAAPPGRLAGLGVPLLYWSAMVLLSPAAHPWYLLWALALVPMSMSPAVWIASLTISWGYIAWRYQLNDDGSVGWGVPWAVMVAAWAPVYAAIIWSIPHPHETVPLRAS